MNRPEKPRSFRLWHCIFLFPNDEPNHVQLLIIDVYTFEFFSHVWNKLYDPNSMTYTK